MSDLILRVRLSVLAKSLQQVQAIRGDIMRRRDQLGELHRLLLTDDTKVTLSGLLDGISASVSDAREQVKKLEKDLRVARGFPGAAAAAAPSSGDPAKAMGHLREAADHVDKAQDQLLALHENINQLQSQTVRIEKDALEATLQAELVGMADGWIKTLAEIERGLGGRRGGQRGAEAGEAEARVRAAWKQYHGQIAMPSRAVFEDYVDLLAGAALRDTGIDQQICEIADDLVTACDKVEKYPFWKSLTVPAYQEKVTRARLVRLGFPEWTIWALPLAARELGLMSIARARESGFDDGGVAKGIASFLARFPPGATPAPIPAQAGDAPGADADADADTAAAATRSPEDAHRCAQDCLADAFATFVMGPAYACSAILLRLDPFDAGRSQEGHAPHALRAAVILHALREMDVGPRAAYQRTIDLLEAEWAAAVDQARTDGVRAAPADDAPAALGRWVNEVGVFLANGREHLTYRGAVEPVVRRHLLALIADPDAGVLPQGGDVRDLLNAAWACRLHGEPAGAEPPPADQIAERAKRLWQEMKVSARQGGTGARAVFGRQRNTGPITGDG